MKRKCRQLPSEMSTFWVCGEKRRERERLVVKIQIQVVSAAELKRQTRLIAFVGSNIARQRI